MNRDIETFCREFGGFVVGTEHRYQKVRYPLSYPPVKIEMSDLIREKEHTIVSIPTENIEYFIKYLETQSRSKDENWQTEKKKQELYQTDPVFKKLYDHMNTYLHMVGDL